MNIMVAWDDPGEAELLSLYLSGGGDNTVVLAGSGDELLSQARASTWDAVVHGRSGIALVERFETHDLDVKIGGEVKNFDPTTYMDRKEARRMDRFLHLGIVAAQEAMRDSELKIGPHNAEHVGVLVGSALLGTLSAPTTPSPRMAIRGGGQSAD